MGARIRKGDQVVVTAGKDKGKRGEVLRVLPEVGRVIVQGVAVVKRHQKPSPRQPQGSINEKEMPIHLSNVMPLDTKEDRPTRVRTGTDQSGKKVRLSVRSGTVLDK